MQSGKPWKSSPESVTRNAARFLDHPEARRIAYGFAQLAADSSGGSITRSSACNSPPAAAQPEPRRQFVRSMLGGGVLASGYAAAVMPSGELWAQVQRTDAHGLEAGAVLIPSAGFNMPAYRAMPAQYRPRGVILVVHEVWGVHEYIRDVCRRFAKEGYLALAPDFFGRQGDVSVLQAPAEIFAKVVNFVSDHQVIGDLDASVEWLKGQGVNTARLGITGFCWGGRIVWLYGAERAELRAGVAWYGRLTTGTNAQTPFHPLDVADKLKVPVLGLYGGKDDGIPLSQVDEMKTRLSFGDKASAASEIVVYPEAPHAFHADYRPTFRADAARDGWTRCLAWFDRHLG
jgi:carboxymethylenebutenolidase